MALNSAYANVLQVVRHPERYPFLPQLQDSFADSSNNDKLTAYAWKPLDLRRAIALETARARNGKSLTASPEIPNVTREEEDVVAGTVASAYAAMLVRVAQNGFKVDDLSVVVGIVY